MQRTLVKFIPLKYTFVDGVTYISYVGSKINSFCSDSKVELRKIKMQVSKLSIYIKARAILNVNPISTKAKIKF